MATLTLTDDEIDEALNHSDLCLCPLCEALVWLEIEEADRDDNLSGWVIL